MPHRNLIARKSIFGFRRRIVSAQIQIKNIQILKFDNMSKTFEQKEHALNNKRKMTWSQRQHR